MLIVRYFLQVGDAVFIKYTSTDLRLMQRVSLGARGTKERVIVEGILSNKIENYFSASIWGCLVTYSSVAEKNVDIFQPFNTFIFAK